MCIVFTESVIDFDRILVLHQGRVAEFDEPLRLLDQSDSILRNMVEATGSWDRIYKTASEASRRCA